MTYGAFTSHEVAAFDGAAYGMAKPAKPIPQTILCAAALALSSAVGLFMLYGRPVAPPAFEAAAVVVPVAKAERAAPTPAAIPPLRRFGALLDPTLIKRQAPGAFAQSAPLRTSFAPLRHPAGVPTVTAQILAEPALSPVAALPTRVPPQVATPAPAAPAPQQVAKAELVDIDTDTGAPEIPLPMPRPTSLTTLEHAPVRAPAAAAVRMAEAEMPAPRTPAAAVAPAAPAPEAGQPGFFEKFFGGAARPGNALGYANSEDGFFGSGRGSAAPDRYTAVYDITRHTVTLPDGTRLEAHSGYGDLVDNPAGVAVRMRGATPPNMYELKEREAIFHGVRALRMTPTGGTTYGRGGLLTHSYMLRGRLGESNGCVVFANYPAFLRAYDTGMVRRLLVVARAS